MGLGVFEDARGTRLSRRELVEGADDVGIRRMSRRRVGSTALLSVGTVAAGIGATDLSVALFGETDDPPLPWAGLTLGGGLVFALGYDSYKRNPHRLATLVNEVL